MHGRVINIFRRRKSASGVGIFLRRFLERVLAVI
jgi:hypothetical protein